MKIKRKRLEQLDESWMVKAFLDLPLDEAVELTPALDATCISSETQGQRVIKVRKHVGN
jgi:hypothetical protein